MELRTALWEIKDQVECTACGKCCPRICPNKKENSCAAHPQVIGTEGRDYACQLTPIELTLGFEIACPPVLDLIHRETGISLPTIDAPLGITRVDHQDFSSALQTRVSQLHL